jgi:energy-coupling factor transporter ATP-binding protein EcfA2
MGSTAIKRIVVSRLFGSYNYDLSPSAESDNPDRLIILYGDNGSGKTTILRILFHLLAPEIGERHKTALVAIPFSRFDVHFTSGDHVWAHRPEGKVVGGFEIGFRGRNRKYTADFRPDEAGAIKANPATNKFLQRLAKLRVGLYFLSDDRTVRLAGLSGRDVVSGNADVLELQEEGIVTGNVAPHIVMRRGSMEPEQRARQLLAESLGMAGQWIQSQAVRSAAEGESSVNALYGEILNRISRMPLEKATDKSKAVEQLGDRLAKLEVRSREYSKYGLQPEFTGKDILGIVKNAPPSHVTVITTVLTPYIESVEKKLDAMGGLQTQVDALVRLVNSFYTRKRLSYEIHNGFRISTEEGKTLQPEMLSSGERHLLLLFCNVMQTLNRPSIFIIDEPEISLNIKWQRRLLSALLECAANNPLQYLFATHSLELLAQYQKNAIRLSHNLEEDNGT